MKKLLIWLTAVLAAVTMTACGGNDEPTAGEYELEATPKSFELVVGESRRLRVLLTPSVDGVEYRYESNNKSVATVTRKGEVTGCAEGSARITVSCLIGNTEVSAKCRVTVVPFTLTFKPEEAVLLVGDQQTLTPVGNIDYDPSDIQWSTSDASVATVSGGKVKAIALGECTVTASLNGAEADCRVRVVAPGVYVIPEHFYMIAGDTASVTITLLGQGDETYSFNNNNPEIAYYDGNRHQMVAVKQGSTSVMFSTSKAYANCLITVDPLILTVPYYILYKGEQLQLTCNAAHVRWITDNSSVLSVDANGLVTCNGEGEAYITAINGNVQTTCRFTCYLERDYAFSVSDTTKVYIAPGNLQYQPSSQTWRFASEQYECLANSNAAFDGTANYSGWIDLFCYGTGDNPLLTRTNCPTSRSFTDWGENAIHNGDQLDPANTWRTLTYSECNYLMSERYNWLTLRAFGRIDTIPGLFLLPDRGCSHAFSTSSENNKLTYEEWEQIEQEGVIFLPRAGYGGYVNHYSSNGTGYYWLHSTYRNALYVKYDSWSLELDDHDWRYSVRLVRDAD